MLQALREPPKSSILWTTANRSVDLPHFSGGSHRGKGGRLPIYNPLGRRDSGRLVETASTSTGSLIRDFRGSFISASAFQVFHQGPPPTSTAARLEFASSSSLPPVLLISQSLTFTCRRHSCSEACRSPKASSLKSHVHLDSCHEHQSKRSLNPASAICLISPFLAI